MAAIPTAALNAASTRLPRSRWAGVRALRPLRAPPGMIVADLMAKGRPQVAICASMTICVFTLCPH
eukprot:3160122-Prymnesium_polylepis.1